MSWLDDSISTYYEWLKSRTSARTIDETGWSVITTPFIGSFNDPINIYVRKVGDKVEFSDDGVIADNLSQQGISISRSPKKKEIVSYILLNYGVDLVDDELHSIVPIEMFAQAKHNMLSAMIEMSEMALTVKSSASSIFREEVRDFFDSQNLIYTPQFIVKGATGLEFTFDFQFAGRTKETVVKSFSSLNKINVPNFLVTWQDVRENRESTSGKTIQGMAIVNDTIITIRQEYTDALLMKGCDILPWSQKDSPQTKERLQQLYA